MEKNRQNLESELLLITKQFLLEQEKERLARSVALDVSLERQLGIDSLGKVELFHRIEKTFGIHFEDSAFAKPIAYRN